MGLTTGQVELKEEQNLSLKDNYHMYVKHDIVYLFMTQFVGWNLWSYDKCELPLVPRQWYQLPTLVPRLDYIVMLLSLVWKEPSVVSYVLGNIPWSIKVELYCIE